MEIPPQASMEISGRNEKDFHKIRKFLSLSFWRSPGVCLAILALMNAYSMVELCPFKINNVSELLYLTCSDSKLSQLGSNESWIPLNRLSLVQDSSLGQIWCTALLKMSKENGGSFLLLLSATNKAKSAF